MHLVTNWRAVLQRAWSIRLHLIAGTCLVGEFLLPYFADGLSRGLLAALAIIFQFGGIIARIVAQKGMSDVD